MPVPYSFGAATSAIPLSQLDANFNTPITLGNTAIQLGNTVTTLNNMTLANVTISSGNVTITNVTVTTANATTVNTTTLIATTANVTTGNVTNLISGNVSLTGGSITGTPISGSTGSFTTLTTSSTVTLNGGTANGVAYLNASNVLTTGSALTFDGSGFGVGGNAGAGVRIYTRTAATTGTAFQADNGVNTGFVARFEPSLTLIGNDFSQPLAFLISNTEQMRLTSTGLGIGTSSPGYKLDVQSAGAAVASFKGAANTYVDVTDGTGNFRVQLLSNIPNIGSSTNHNVNFITNNVARATLDTSGNLGLGVTPSAWTSGYSVLQTAGVGSFVGASQGLIGTNLYVAAGPQAKFIANGYAPAYTTVASTGQHIWYTTGNNVSGAGANATLTQAMTLDASGNLIVGGTSAVYTNANRGNISINGTSTALLGLSTGGTGRAYLYTDGSRLDLLNTQNDALTFGTNNTERARIDSSGNLLVGKTSAGSLTINGGEIAASGYANFVRDTSSGFVEYVNNNNASGTGLVEYRRQTTIVGSITTNGTGVTYGTASDYRLKEDVQPMTGALAKVAALKPCTYKWKADGSAGEGFIAHELAEVCPPAVSGEKDAVNEDGSIKPQCIDTSFLVATLAAAIKELKAEFDAYKATHP